MLDDSFPTAFLVVTDYERLSGEKIPALLVLRDVKGSEHLHPRRLAVAVSKYCKAHPGYKDITPMDEPVLDIVFSSVRSNRVWKRMIIAPEGSRYRNYWHGMNTLQVDEVLLVGSVGRG